MPLIPPELYGPAGALAALGFMVIGFLRGDLVPGWLYKAAIARAEKAEVQAERNTDALEAVALTVKSALDDRARRDAT